MSGWLAYFASQSPIFAALTFLFYLLAAICAAGALWTTLRPRSRKADPGLQQAEETILEAMTPIASHVELPRQRLAA